MYILSVQYSDGPLNLARHYHDAHQVLCVTEGAIAVTVGNQDYTVTAGSMLILSRFEEHSIRVLSPVYRRYAVRISSEIASGQSAGYLLSSVLVNRADTFRHLVETGERHSTFVALFRQMEEEYREKRPMYEEQLDLLLWQLLIMLYRHAPELFMTYKSHCASLVQEIQSAFERDYRDRFSLSELSAHYHISPSHLARSFKSVTGYAPMEYLMICRLSAAKRLLGTTDKPIKEIIDLCGFSDESNFSRTFKEKTGMTPTAFRKQYRA